VVLQKCHSEFAAHFDRLSDRAADEESASPIRDSSRLSEARDKFGLFVTLMNE